MRRRKMQMGLQKQPDTSPEALLARADECIAIAEVQHELAEKQHVGADHLEKSAEQLNQVGLALEASAIEISGLKRMEMERRPPTPLPDTPK
jgi:hypothetical protein